MARAPIPGRLVALAALLGVQVALFGTLTQTFTSLTNFTDIARVAIEVGLVALALVPLVAAGGIDLSVGSAMGLAGAVLGLSVKHANLTLASGVSLALLAGAVGGGVNALLTTGLRVPALVATIATWGLLRGLAEALVAGRPGLSGFRPALLDLGRDAFLLGLVPVALPLLVVVALAAARLGTARVPPAVPYVVSGLLAALAGVLQVARTGRAGADTGATFEILAVGAVVLGGGAPAGGRASVAGTVLGAFAIATLDSGLRASGVGPHARAILVAILFLAVLAHARLNRVST